MILVILFECFTNVNVRITSIVTQMIRSAFSHYQYDKQFREHSQKCNGFRTKIIFLFQIFLGKRGIVIDSKTRCNTF